jgi:hypothetical protein
MNVVRIPNDAMWRFDAEEIGYMDMVINHTYVAAIDGEVDLVYFCNPNVLWFEDRGDYTKYTENPVMYAIVNVV